MRWIKRLVLGLLALVLLLAAVLTGLLRGSLAQLDGERNASAAELAAPVELQRDARGYLSVVAENRLDAARALGFAHAQERFFQMDLLRRNAGLVHRVAAAYARDPADREDIVQEAAIQLWQAADRFDGRGRESTFVYRIAFNVAMSFHRRQRRHRQRRVYTQSHIDWVIETFAEVMRRKDQLAGFDIVEQPQYLRAFTAKLAPIAVPAPAAR